MKMPTEKDIEKEAERIREEYAYLDSLPHEGWIWEFVRRSMAYRNAYLFLKRHCDSLLPWNKDFGVIEFLQPPPSIWGEVLQAMEKIKSLSIDFTWQHSTDSRFQHGCCLDGCTECDRLANEGRSMGLNQDHFLVNKFWFWTPLDFNSCARGGYPNPDINYSEFADKPVITGANPIRYVVQEDMTKHINRLINITSEAIVDIYRLRLDTYRGLIRDAVRRACRGVWSFLLEPDKSERVLFSSEKIQYANQWLYLGVSRREKKRETKQAVMKALDDFLDDGRTKVRGDKWKYYLVTFDLKWHGNKDMTYSILSEILYRAYGDEEDGDFLADMKILKLL